jgi:hypothetical protein
MPRIGHLLFALLASAASSACASQSGATGTRVARPAHANPDEMAFGTGRSFSVGSKSSLVASDAVVVAAASDAKGPSDASEGDSLWRVRAGTLELCERANDAREDCRLATYEGFAPPAMLTFLPTIVEQGNLARGAQAQIFGNNPALLGSVASRETRPVRYVDDKAVWITAGAAALIGAQPAFLCVSRPEGPVCRSLPFVVSGMLGSLVVQEGERRVPVLWVHAAANVANFGLAGIPQDLGIFRCAAIGGHPQCKKAKEAIGP